MKDTLLFLLQSIVEHPQDIVLDERNEENRTIFIIHANTEDKGKIIGKSGRIIRAIRDLIKLMAAKHNTYVDVELAEDDIPPDNSETTPTD